MSISIMMLRCFAAVAQTGNLADAGSLLGRTQSAVSMTLRQLEDHLGARLFETDRKNRLTPLGVEIFELAQQQLRQFDTTIDTIKTVSRSPKGLLRIAAVPSVAHQGLVTALDLLIARHPHVQIDLRDTDSDVVISALQRNQADIGIVSGAPSLNGVRKSLLFEDDFGLVCSAQHPLMSRAEPPTFDDLPPTCFVRNNLCAMIQTAAFQSPLRQACVTARNTLSLIALIRTGRWVTVLPNTVVGIFPDDLAFRRIEGLNESRQVSLLVRERSLFPELVDELTEILNGLDWKQTLN